MSILRSIATPVALLSYILTAQAQTPECDTLMDLAKDATTEWKAYTPPRKRFDDNLVSKKKYFDFNLCEVGTGDRGRLGIQCTYRLDPTKQAEKQAAFVKQQGKYMSSLVDKLSSCPGVTIDGIGDDEGEMSDHVGSYAKLKLPYRGKQLNVFIQYGHRETKNLSEANFFGSLDAYLSNSGQ